MSFSLAHLRLHAPRITAREFLAAHPGSWLQYYDDTPARDPAKALSAPRFETDIALRKQGERCAIGFSLQPFGKRRTRECLLFFRTLGVDVDLVPSGERETLAPDAIDRRKDEYLKTRLSLFPLRPHWLIETRHGFHILFRVQPQTEPKTIEAAQALNRRLVYALGGDPNAVLVTQLLRVPGTLQFKVPARPFLCRLLLDESAAILPYGLEVVRVALDGSGEPPLTGAVVDSSPRPNPGTPRPRWHAALAGVSEGERNATAACLVGAILRRLPEELWETAGWGGLTVWNGRNSTPLPERELRAVFESISRREVRKRHHTPGRRDDANTSPASHAQH
jgi:hypothetical protein